MTQGFMAYMWWPWRKRTNTGVSQTHPDASSLPSAPALKTPAAKAQSDPPLQLQPARQQQPTAAAPATATLETAAPGATMHASHGSPDSANISIQEFVRVLARGPIVVDDLDSDTSAKPAVVQSSPLKAKRKRKFKKYERSKDRLVINPSSESETSDVEIPVVHKFARRSSGYMEVERLILSDLDHESHILLNVSVSPHVRSHAPYYNAAANAPIDASAMAKNAPPHQPLEQPSEHPLGQPLGPPTEEPLFVPEYSDERDQSPPAKEAPTKRSRLNKKRKSSKRKTYRELLRTTNGAQSLIGSSPYKQYPAAVHSTPRPPAKTQLVSSPKHQAISPVVRAFQMSLMDQKLEISLPPYSDSSEAHEAQIRQVSPVSQTHAAPVAMSQKSVISTSQSANLSDVVIPASSEGKLSQLIGEPNGFTVSQMAVDSSQETNGYSVLSQQTAEKAESDLTRQHSTNQGISNQHYPHRSSLPTCIHNILNPLYPEPRPDFHHGSHSGPQKDHPDVKSQPHPHRVPEPQPQLHSVHQPDSVPRSQSVLRLDSEPRSDSQTRSVPQSQSVQPKPKPKKRRIVIIPYETKKDPGDEIRERFQRAGQDFGGFGVDLDLDLSY